MEPVVWLAVCNTPHSVQCLSQAFNDVGGNMANISIVILLVVLLFYGVAEIIVRFKETKTRSRCDD